MLFVVIVTQPTQDETRANHLTVWNDNSKIIGDESIIKDYGRVRIFLDENFENLEKFTALGSLYLVHDSVENVKLYNFETAQYESLEGMRKTCLYDLVLEQTVLI